MDIKQLINEEFPQEKDLYYLNHAGVSPWPRRTAEAIKYFAEENCVLGATNYKDWLVHESLLRQQLKTLINADSIDEIALLKNTSEALSMVATGIDWHDGDNIVSTDQEFPSNRIPWLAQAEYGVKFREVNITGVDEPEQALIDACDENTRLLTISSVQYGSGIGLNLGEIGRFCKDNQILFCVDAIQSIGAMPFDVEANHIDFAMADGHKWMLGPEGIALFYCRKDKQELLKLQQYGWHMLADYSDFTRKSWEIAENARRFECGSPNMLGIHGLSASVSLILEIGIDVISRNLLDNISYLIDSLEDLNDISFITPLNKGRMAGILTFNINGKDPAIVHSKLLKNKVICAHRYGGIRFSPHFYTSRNILDKSIDILNSIN